MRLNFDAMVGKFTPLNYVSVNSTLPGTTSAACTMMCDAGFGCAFGADFSKENQVCVMCPIDTFSPAGSSLPCQSCVADTSWYAASAKATLVSSADRGACIIPAPPSGGSSYFDGSFFDPQSCWWKPCHDRTTSMITNWSDTTADLACIFLAVVAMRLAYLLLWRERWIHRFARRRMNGIPIGFIGAAAGHSPQSLQATRDLICRPGYDGDSPIEIVLSGGGEPCPLSVDALCPCDGSRSMWLRVLLLFCCLPCCCSCYCIVSCVHKCKKWLCCGTDSSMFFWYTMCTKTTTQPEETGAINDEYRDMARPLINPAGDTGGDTVAAFDSSSGSDDDEDTARNKLIAAMLLANRLFAKLPRSEHTQEKSLVRWARSRTTTCFGNLTAKVMAWGLGLIILWCVFHGVCATIWLLAFVASVPNGAHNESSFGSHLDPSGDGSMLPNDPLDYYPDGTTAPGLVWPVGRTNSTLGFEAPISVFVYLLEVGFFFVLIAGVLMIIASLYVYRLVSYLQKLAISDGDADTISAGVSLVITICFITAGSFASSILGGFWASTLGAIELGTIGSVAWGLFGTYIGGVFFGPLFGSLLSKPVDPMYAALNNMLKKAALSETTSCDNPTRLEHGVSTKYPTSDMLWPLFWASLESAGPQTWRLILPVTPRPDREKKERELARDIAIELGKRRFRSEGATYGGMNVLHTLVQAHIGGVANAENCAYCIAEVIKFEHASRRAGSDHQLEFLPLLRLEKMIVVDTALTLENPAMRGAGSISASNENGASPAELAMVSAQARCVKEAVLEVIFARFGIVSLKETLYESRTCRVYRAEDLEKGGVVAIKIFRSAAHFAKERGVRLSLRNHFGIAKFVVDDVLVLDATQLKPTRPSDDVEALLAEFSGGAVVMPLAAYDLNTRLALTRIAGANATKCVAILKPIAEALSQLHHHGIVHGDVKPRNVVFIGGTWKLIDFDAARAGGETIDASNGDVKWTSGFASPELARCCEALGRIDARPSLDIFAFGVLAFELCSGQRLFAQDICNNNMTSPSDLCRLCVWCDISDEKLALVFSNDDVECCSAQQREDARHFIRACLQGDPLRRMSMDSLAQHRFLGGLIRPPSPRPTNLASQIDGTTLQRILSRDTLRPKYHIFISHVQKEASGDVGTLFFLFEQMGLHGWRDMNQLDLTLEGMRQGVYDSDVFIILLTNSYLSRPFCVAELEFALEFGKPIIIIVEEETRFWPFDLTRWQNNKCERTSSGGWGTGVAGGTMYEACSLNIRELIESRWADGSMLSFRRRNYEVNALAAEVVRLASTQPDVEWGSYLPSSALSKLSSSVAQRRIAFVAVQTPRGDAIIEDCKRTISTIAGSMTQWSSTIAGSTHVVVILSKGCVDAGAPSTAQLEEAVQQTKSINFVFIEPNESNSDEAWNFGAFYALHTSSPSTATRAVSDAEALKYREVSPPSKRYEHDALMVELLARM